MRVYRRAFVLLVGATSATSRVGRLRRLHRATAGEAGGIISADRSGDVGPFVSASRGLRTPLPPTFSACVSIIVVPKSAWPSSAWTVLMS